MAEKPETTLSDEKITFSIATKDRGILTKIMRMQDGNLVKDASQCHMIAGTIETMTCSIEDFSPLLRKLQPQQALIHGISEYPLARITTKAAFNKDPGTTTNGVPIITRTLKHLCYPKGPGLCPLDHDEARENAVCAEDKATQAYTPDQLMTILEKIDPALEKAAWISTPSTSACIFDADGNEVRGNGSGARIYLFAKDARDVLRYLKALGGRLILAGYGRIEISRSGALLTKTLIDLSVGSPERLDFAAGAVCEDGLKQRLPDPHLHEGGLLDTRLLSGLSKAEERSLESLVQDLRERAKPAQSRVRGTYLEQETSKLVQSKNMDPDTAREIVKTRQRHVLSDDDVLYFSFFNGKSISVSEMLDDGETFHGQPLADPLEPDYDGGSLTKAKFFWNGGNPKIHSFAHGNIIYTFERTTDGLEEGITDLLERVSMDCGAPFEPESIELLAKLKRQDKSRYMQIRSEIKRRNNDVILNELDKDISVCCNRNRKRSSSSSSSSFSGNYPSSDPSLDKKLLHFKEALISYDEKGNRSLVPQSVAAGMIAEALKGLYAYDSVGKVWYRFETNHWQECKGAEFESAVTTMLYAGTDGLGFSNSYGNGVSSLLQKGGQNHLPTPLAGKIPFQNGLLDTAFGQLEPVKPENAFTWILPYVYDAQALCPNFIAWLNMAVDKDDQTIELIRAYINALVTGRDDLQVFLHLIGPAGSGKSTFGRLAFELVGHENATTTSLKQLETNRFEPANLYGKRLVAIEEADKYGGSVNVLKSMTGRDPLRLERKHVQQQGSFIYTGQTLMMSNERLATSDYTSGIERRRITIEFNHRITPEERAAWTQSGGESRILYPEAPGIINWALGLSYDQVTQIFKKMPERIRKANLEAARYNNPILDWMLTCLIPNEDWMTQVGCRQEVRLDGEIRFKKEKEWLYPNYLTWSQQSNRKSVSLQRFSSALIDAATSHGASVYRKRINNGTMVVGLRIRVEGEETWQNRLEKGLSMKKLVKDNQLEMFEMKEVKDFSNPSHYPKDM